MIHDQQQWQSAPILDRHTCAGGAQPLIAGARTPVCPTLATPLGEWSCSLLYGDVPDMVEGSWEAASFLGQLLEDCEQKYLSQQVKEAL